MDLGALAHVQYGNIRFYKNGKRSTTAYIGRIDSADHIPKIARAVKNALNGIGIEMKPREVEELLPRVKTEIINDNIQWRVTRTEAKRGEEKSEEKNSLIALCKDFKLFKDQYGYGYAAVKRGEGVAVYPLRSRDFKTLLLYEFYKRTGKNPSSEQLNSLINALEGRAIHEGRVYELHNRVAFSEDAILYDLGGDWKLVKITAEGWEIIPHDVPIFRRFQNTKAQVQPANVNAEAFKRLVKHINLGEEDEVVVLPAIASYLIPGISHPILHFYGEQGNAKSTCCKMIKRIIDPGLPDALSLPDDRCEFIQQLYYHYLLFYDNVSSLTKWQSDEICKAVTGGGSSKRALYTDDDGIVYVFISCFVLNGINMVTIEPDIFDRTILVELKHVSEEDRKTEREVWEAFEADIQYIPGGLFSAISKAMEIVEDVRAEMKEVGRLADFYVGEKLRGTK